MAGNDSEKVSINVGVVDLGQIDLLVDQGFYSNRSDFFRTATRNLLTNHASTVQDQVAQGLMVLGVLRYNAKTLEVLRSQAKMLDIRIVGVVTIADDVTAQLALSTIRSLKVFGTFRASPEVKEALASRIEA